MADAFVGKGTIFNRWSGTTWVALAQIKSIGGPSSSRETVDTTTMDSVGGYREFIGSLRDAGEISLSMNFTQAAYLLMKTDFESDTLQDYQIVLPDTNSTTLEFSGLVTDLPLDIPLDDVVSCDVSIKVSGETELTSVDIISAVTNPVAITVANGTQLANANLSATIAVTYSDGSTSTCAVTWNAGTPQFDGGTAGDYVFVATLAPAIDVVNPDALSGAVTVTVSPA